MIWYVLTVNTLLNRWRRIQGIPLRERLRRHDTTILLLVTQHRAERFSLLFLGKTGDEQLILGRAVFARIAGYDLTARKNRPALHLCGEAGKQVEPYAGYGSAEMCVEQLYQPELLAGPVHAVKAPGALRCCLTRCFSCLIRRYHS